MSKVLMVSSNKGGVGKTTFVVNLAVLLVRRGLRVILIKADKNPEISGWQDRRKDAGLDIIPIKEADGNIADLINSLKLMADVILIDTAGHDNMEFRSALGVADILISPIRPSAQVEVDTLVGMTNIVRKAQSLSNSELKPYVLLYRCKTLAGNTDATDLSNALKANPAWLQPCETRISSLDIFEKSFNEGKAVHDFDRGSSLGKAKAQIELLADELGLVSE